MSQKSRKKITGINTRFHSPYDDALSWVRGDLPCPWTQDEIDVFQKQIDSAFGAEKALVLAWSLDRTYWDEIYMDEWHVHGEPKGRPQKMPQLLFKQVPVNDVDYMFISAPRWMILEKIHASQLEASWEDSSWVQDSDSLGGKKRIRTKNPPEFMYQPLLPPLGTIAWHQQSPDGTNACCEKAWETKNICYGRYRPPAESDIAEIRKIRERMDRDGVAQRADAPRDVKLLERARLQTGYMIRQAEQRRNTAVREMILGAPQMFTQDIMKNYGATPTQIDTALREAFKETI